MRVESCTLVVSGIPSKEAPERLAEALRCLLPGGELLIDLTRAPEIEAVGLARMVRHLEARGDSTVRFLGLRRRDWRLLTYLGLDLELDASGCAVVIQERGAQGEQASG